MQTPIKIGDLLVAEPFMWDSNFRKSVILLTDHHDEGTHGFILNRPLGIPLNDLFAPFPHIDAEVYYGGPVATDTLHFLHNMGELLSDSLQIDTGIWWGGDLEELRFLIENELITTKNIRFFVGYSGWNKGQLLAEILDGTWIQATNDPNYLFRSPTDTLWRDVLAHKNENFAVIGDMNGDLLWN